jgi:hypothetical protein
MTNKKKIYECIRKGKDPPLYLLIDGRELICAKGFVEGEKYSPDEIEIKQEFFQWVGDNWGQGYYAPMVHLKKFE